MTSLKTSLKTLTIAALAAAALVSTVAPSQALNRHFPTNTTYFLGNQFGHGITCLACNLPRPYRPFPVWGHGPRWPIFGQHWGHWGQWYRWHPVFYRGGAPVGPVAAAPAAAMPGPAAAAPQAPTGNCLTKQMLPNGAELLIDRCTQQSAIALPQNMSAR
jgi:hypothetical protein